MSFDLYVFPPPGPTSVGAVHRLFDEIEAWDGDHDSVVPNPATKAFIEELERRWPDSDADPDASPWASWPLWEPEIGGGCGLNIRWSRAEEMYPAIVALAEQMGVVIYNPQDEVLHRPASAGRLRRLFRR